MPRILPVLFVVPLVGASVVLAVEPEPVNPFSRPVLEATPVGAADEPVAITRPELRGVIEAGERSIANLNGTLLAIGEEASGYELDSVTEDSATFVYRGETITLVLEESQLENRE